MISTAPAGRSLVPVPTPVLSVVVPLFDEHENLPALYRRLIEVLKARDDTFELVFVNDGSRDATPGMLELLAAADGRVVAVHLSRNFGHQAAVTAGLDHARGSAVVVMDGDLQDPPEVLPRFLDCWKTGVDVVYAVRRNRKEGPVKRLGYFAFYRLLRAVADVNTPLDSGDFCLMDRRVVDALNRLPERCRFVRGLRSFVGFHQVGIEYERDARRSGDPKYTFRKLVGLAVDGILNFSGVPLRAIVAAGLGAGAVAVGWVGWMLAAGVTAGWAVVAALLLGSGAVQLLALGVVGEYVRRIFQEVKGRPTYIVSSVTRRESAETDLVRRLRPEPIAR